MRAARRSQIAVLELLQGLTPLAAHTSPALSLAPALPLPLPFSPRPLQDLDAAAVSKLLLGSNDLVLWLDGEGVVQGAQSNQPPLQALCSAWVGQPWIVLGTVVPVYQTGGRSGEAESSGKNHYERPPLRAA